MKRETIEKLICSKKSKLSKTIADGIKRKSTLKMPLEDEFVATCLLGEDGAQHTIDFIKNSDPIFYRCYGSFIKLMTNPDFNPGKHYPLKDYFQDTSTNLNDLNTIYECFEEDEVKKNIILLGEKGSGKTAAQNIWLHDNKDEFDDKKIFFVRCDASKVYDLWLSNIEFIATETANEKEKKGEKCQLTVNEAATFTITEYLDLQFMYVFSKYCMSDERKTIRNILKLLVKSRIEISYPMGRTADDEYYQRKNLYDLVLSNNEVIRVEEEAGRVSNKRYSYLVDHLLQRSLISSQRQKRRWIAISLNLQKFLYDNGYSILKIVDGVDNIHINNRNAEYYFYKLMCRISRKWLREEPVEKEVRLMVSRERTYLDMKKYDPALLTSSSSFEVEELHQDTPEFKEAWECRVKHYNNIKIHSRPFDDILSSIYSATPSYIAKNYHNNLRDFLFNKCTLMLQVYYRVQQINLKEPDYMYQAKLFVDRNKLLNGRLFLDSRKWDDVNMSLGQIFFNIFYFDNTKYPTSSKNWIGLCNTRILQALSVNNYIEHSVLAEELHCLFGYPPDYIESCIINLRAWGMVDSKGHRDPGFVNLTISDKGIYALEELYSNCHLLYYLALDTPLPDSLFEDNLINAHENKFKRRTNYPYAVVSTVLTFVNYLCSMHDIEVLHYKKIDKKREALLFHDTNLTFPLLDKDIQLRLTDCLDKLSDTHDVVDNENIELFFNNNL